MRCISILATIWAVAVSALAQAPPEVRPDQMADLAALELRTDPEYPKPGEDVSVRLTMRNRATHAERRVPVTLFAGSTRVATIHVSVPAGETQTATLRWKAPEAGTYILTGRIDPDGTVAERERTDNDAALTVVVAPTSAANADFAISSIDVGPDTATDGTMARIAIVNNGREASRAPLSVTIDGRRIALQLVQLAPRESKTIEVPLPHRPGRISAEIIARSLRGAISRDLRPPFDLSVEQLSVAASQFDERRPRQVTISFRIVNRGREAIRTPFTVSIFPGLVRPGPPLALAGDQVVVRELPSGASAYISRTIVSPVGEFDVRIEADVNRAVTGDDRANNVATWHFKNPAAEVGRWVSIGARLITGGLGAVGRLSAIAMDRSAPDTIYVGAAGAGVWKTLDGGATWQPIADSFPTLAIAALAIAPTNPSTVFAATAGSGVFRSNDGGGTWQGLANSPNGEVRWGVLIVSPRDANRLYMTAADGIHRSTDGGVTWSRVLSNGRATDLVMAQGSPSTLYASVFGDGIYQTADDGNTWTRLGNGLPAAGTPSQITLAIARNAPRSLYAGYTMPGGLQLFRSDDGGATWTQKSTPADTTLYNDVIGVDPVDPNFVYVTGINLWRSTDGGMTFTRATGPHVDYHAFLNDPIAPETIYGLSDGGIFKSVDRGQAWTFVGAGLTNVEFYDHGVAPSDPILTFGGTQDNGTLKFAGNADWSGILGGDGATVAIDPTDPNIIYAMNQGADSVQRTANGASFANFAKNLPTGAVCNNLHFQIHPRTRTTLLASCLSLWRTTTTTPPGDWQQILAQPAPGSIVRSAVDLSIDLYYAGTTDGRIMAGPGGANWQTIFVHPTGAGVTDIDVDAVDPRVVFVSFKAAGVDRLYRLTRSSAAPATVAAQAIGTGLPAGLTVQTLAVDLSLNFTVYAGTTRGVYRGRASSPTGGWLWAPYTMGMPLADVRDLEVHPKTGVLRAVTFGRSAFEVNTVDPLGSVLGAEGRITLLRAHDVGTGYGPPSDFLDTEAIVWLDTAPGSAFGLQLREDASKAARRGMFGLLRKAFVTNRRVRIDYERTGLRSGRIIRVMLIP